MGYIFQIGAEVGWISLKLRLTPQRRRTLTQAADRAGITLAVEGDPPFLDLDPDDAEVLREAAIDYFSEVGLSDNDTVSPDGMLLENIIDDLLGSSG